MKNFKPGFFVLSILSAVLLSAGFLFPHCGGFVLIGFVPLLWIDRIASKQGLKHFFWWHYLTFVLWNAATTFWVCNATVGGGIAAILINALEMSVIWALFRLFKSKFSGSLPYIFLVCIWIAWERAYYSAEISWPWLTLGNAFATTTTCIQWYDVTGTIGGSLWIWLCNMAVFGLGVALYEGLWKGFNVKAKTALAVSVIMLFVAPVIWSVIKYVSLRERADLGYVSACTLQPNLDPYLKFEKYTQDEQDEILCRLISEITIAHKGDSLAKAIKAQTTDSQAERDANCGMLFVAPETVTGDVVFVAPETVSGDEVIPRLESSRTLGHLLETIGPKDQILFGASSYEFISSDKAPSYTARPYGKGLWYENHNSAILAGGGCNPQIYHKSRLVIGTEKMPWPRVFSKVDELLGGGVIARCIGQDSVSLLALDDDVKIGCAVCYESVYPEYFASYVAEGARAMAVITNDAWWGDTPGYRQHMNYSRLRAIETRRDIVRSANTGISCFINQRGDVVSSLGWDKRGSLNGRVNLNDEMTPFVLHGDVIGRLCTFLFLILGLALIVRLILGRGKRVQS